MEPTVGPKTLEVIAKEFSTNFKTENARPIKTQILLVGLEALKFLSATLTGASAAIGFGAFILSGGVATPIAIGCWIGAGVSFAVYTGTTIMIWIIKRGAPKDADAIEKMKADLTNHINTEVDSKVDIEKNKLEGDIKELNEQIHLKNLECETGIKQLEKNNTEITKTEETIYGLNVQIKEKETLIEKLNSNIKDHENFKNHKSIVTNLKKEVENANKTINQLEVEIGLLKAKNKQDSQNSQISEEIKTRLDSYDKMVKENQEKKNTINELQNKLNGLKNDKTYKETVRQLEKETSAKNKLDTNSKNKEKLEQLSKENAGFVQYLLDLEEEPFNELKNQVKTKLNTLAKDKNTLKKKIDDSVTLTTPEDQKRLSDLETKTSKYQTMYELITSLE